MAYLVFVERHAAPGRRNELLDAIRSLRSSTEDQPGCISSRLWVSPENPDLMGSFDLLRHYIDWLDWSSSEIYERQNSAVRQFQAGPEQVSVFSDLIRFIDPELARPPTPAPALLRASK